jgi:NTE family protein
MTENTAEIRQWKADAVFEGGGVKGIGLVGALAVAEERGYRWENVAGTSAGAIVAALVAAGYSAQELKEVMTGLDYRNFKDTAALDRLPGIGPLISLFSEKGIFEGDFLKTWIGELLGKKGITTFRDLVIQGEREPRYRFKLRVVASDISRGKLIVLPQDITDYGLVPEDLNVAAAVRMSMSIPFFYEPVLLNNLGSNARSYIVDGGVLSNFPVWLFDSDTKPDWPTFGFKLVEPQENYEIAHPISNVMGMLTALFSTMMEAHDARYIKDEDFVRTIPIPTLGVETTEFGISRERSEALYESGREAAEKFFNAWDFGAYVNRYRTQKTRVSRGDKLRTNIPN